MFKNWGFLIGEMMFLLLIAALLGLLVGWIIWGRRARAEGSSENATQVDALHAQLSAKEAELTQIQDQLATCTAARAQLEAASASIVAPAASEGAEAAVDVDYDGDGMIEGTDEGAKPAMLSVARDGQADDLKMSKGIGPKLEQLCNSLGFYHFDQIAAWSAQEVAWVDANLEGFKGRVSRDQWVAQAKILASGGDTEFASRVKDGDVY